MHPGELTYPFWFYKGDMPLAKAIEDSVLVENNSGWFVNPADYQYNITITGIVDVNGFESDTTADVLGAFVGDECRGVAQPIYIPVYDRYFTFLMVYSNESEGENIQFRFYDSKEKAELYIPVEFDFESNAMIGSADEPYEFHARQLAIGDPGYIPEVFSLGQNFPNPFNPITKIGYGLPEDSHVEIAIYNILGQKVKTLISERQAPGYRFATWDGRDNSGRFVSTGVYIYVMTAGSFHDVKKLLLLK